MNNILALGNAACNIASSLEKYECYNIYRIQNSGKSKKNNFIIPELESAEEYELLEITKKIPFLKKIKQSIAFFVCGGSRSSSLSLKILQMLHEMDLEIEVVYFMPDIEFLSEEQILLERTVRNVLQQYTRSGLFQEITLVSNTILENFVDSINVFEYYEQINSIFCDSYHMTKVFKNTKPVISTFSKIRESCRIKTMGVSSIECNEQLFSPFDNEVEILYYFGINEQKLKAHGELFREITKNVKNKMTKETKVYFGIYPTQYENDYVYVEYFSPKIQLTQQ